MESFFGILNSEIFYGFENDYRNVDELIIAIVEYIVYYNKNRIKK